MNDDSAQLPWSDELECDALAASCPDCNSSPQSEPLELASVWKMQSLDGADQALADPLGDFVYRRDGHPNARSLSAKLTRLHNAQHVILTAQGMSTIAAIALAHLAPGKEVWIGNELYGKSSHLFANNLSGWGVSTHEFDVTLDKQIADLANSQASLVLIETLSNPRLRVADIANIAGATHAAGGKLIVDNTFATHLLCQPLDLMADFVVESLGKQVNGHSDSMLGMIASKDGDAMCAIQDVVSTFGMASSPLDCYLTSRGLVSLAVRMQRACDNALALARALESNGASLNVDYPGLATHPQHALAVAQLRGCFGWMLSFALDGGREAVTRLFQLLQPEIAFLPSLGDACTSVSHPATTSHRGLSERERERLGIDEGTVRVSCGVEPTSWLVDRFTSSLEAAVVQ